MLYGYNDYLYVIDHYMNKDVLSAEFTELYQDMTGTYPDITYSMIFFPTGIYEYTLYIRKPNAVEYVKTKLSFTSYPTRRIRIRKFRSSIREIIKRKLV